MHSHQGHVAHGRLENRDLPKQRKTQRRTTSELKMAARPRLPATLFVAVKSKSFKGKKKKLNNKYL